MNFGDDLTAGLASRLGSCKYIMYRYRHACAATKHFKLATLTQICQVAKIILLYGKLIFVSCLVSILGKFEGLK